MKKYIFRYCFIIAIIIALYLFRKSQPTILIAEFNDYIDKGIIDGQLGAYFILTASACFSLILSIATVITTIPKDNKVKFKYLIATAIILTLFFILPMFRLNYFGGIDNDSGEKYISMFAYIQSIFN